MKTGLYISGFAHLALILFLLFGSYLLPRPERESLSVQEVSILTSEEFAALTAPEPVSVAPQTSPTPPPRPATPPPEPEPQAQPAPEPAPEPTPTPAPTPEPLPTPETAPQDIDRVAPEAAPEPQPNVEIAPVPTPEVSPAETGETPEPELPAAAPEAATTEIVTEATETAELAPTSSPRPRARPNRPAPAPEPDPEPTPAPEPDPDPQPASDPVADAIAAAVAEAATPAPPSTAPTGPPLSRGEISAFRLAVGNCWNVGSLSSEALATTVVVAMSMSEAGKPQNIRLVSFSGGSQAAANRAYETARRAILRCGATGYNLPSEKYDTWKEIEMVFNPENMRIK